MKLIIKHQESFSRGELLLRTLFGAIYIDLPHLFLLIFVGIWSSILTFISWWVILFTGRYPQSFFEFQVGLIKWQVRWMARFYNLADGYPSFGINGNDEGTHFEMPYPENLSRGMAIVKLFFAPIYCALPHGFVLIFVSIWASILRFFAWWIVLFTGQYPKNIHDFNVGLIRWSTRVSLYLSYMTDDYPPFSGKPDESEVLEGVLDAPSEETTPSAEETAPPPPPPPAPEPSVAEEPSGTSEEETTTPSPEEESPAVDEPPAAPAPPASEEPLADSDKDGGEDDQEGTAESDDSEEEKPPQA